MHLHGHKRCCQNLVPELPMVQLKRWLKDQLKREVAVVVKLLNAVNQVVTAHIS